MPFFRCMGNGTGGGAQSPSIERLCYCSENSSSSRNTDHQHIAYFDDGTGTITEDTNYSEYLSYDSTTGKFTVLKSFYALLMPWTYNYMSASSTYSHGDLYINDVKADGWSVDYTGADHFRGISYPVSLSQGDTFYVYTPMSDGYPEQNLKVYNIGSNENIGVFDELFTMYEHNAQAYKAYTEGTYSK